MFNTLRDKGLKLMLNKNPAVNKIAQILDISLKSGEANLKILLKGETEPVSISLNYAIDGNVLSVANVKTSKEWLNGLADAFKDRYSKIDLSRHEKAVNIAKHLL